MWAKTLIKAIIMNSKKQLLVLLAILGEILIVLSFLHFGKGAEAGTLTLNIIVTTLIYGGIISDFISPLISSKDKSQKQIGSLGLRWFVTSSYSIIAAGLMIYFSIVKPAEFISQLLVHGFLFFLFLLGLFGASISSERVEEVYAEEKLNGNKINEMKMEIREIQKRVNLINDLPDEISSRLNDLQESIRFLSPSNNSEALLLENKFIEEARRLNQSFSETPIALEQVISNIKICEMTFMERKQVLSI
jgi:hypothetical protein